MTKYIDRTGEPDDVFEREVLARVEDPMTPVPSSPVALLDQLDELRAKATPGPWAQSNADPAYVIAPRGDEDYEDVADAGARCSPGRPGWEEAAADAALIVAAVNAAGPLAAAVRAALELHKPFGIYTECDHEHTEDDLENDLAFEVMEVGIVCEDGLMYRVCLSCCTGDGYQTEECVTNHEHGKDEPICETVAALAALSVTP